MASSINPEVGQIYKCKGTPSGFILLTKVMKLNVSTAIVWGWGDATGHTASHETVVPLARLRNTKSRGPFSNVSQDRAARGEEGIVDTA